MKDASPELGGAAAASENAASKVQSVSFGLLARFNPAAKLAAAMKERAAAAGAAPKHQHESPTFFFFFLISLWQCIIQRAKATVKPPSPSLSKLIARSNQQARS